MAFVDRSFAVDADFQPGDIISKGQVEPIFKGLELMGWTVPGRKSILDKVPGDTDFVVRQLRSEQGRKFMRELSGVSLAYDRLYRLAAIPRGRTQVHDLIYRYKDGYKMIEYMATTQQGKNLGTQLSQTNGKDFNKPVGKLFTVDALKEELSKSYAATVKAAAQQ